jgi:putative oxidoreductase
MNSSIAFKAMSPSTAGADRPTGAPFTNPREQLWLPFMSGFYDRLAQPLAWVALRVLFGGLLVYEGWPKIVAPLAQVGFVESLHFYPGWFWSPLLAAMQFFGGIAIAVGLLTRPIALANAVMLAITLWFHVSHPYPARLLTETGIAFMKSGGAEYFSPAGLRPLADGGRAFLAQVQDKANLLSLLWTGVAVFFAGFGGGPWSVDRCVVNKEF